MKQTKNDRVELLKTALDLGTNEFAIKAGISSGTLWNIANGGNIAPKTGKAIVKSFNVNKEWWETGKGDMFSSEPREIEVTQNPWREEAYKSLKDEIVYLRKLLEIAVSGNPNFQEATDLLRAA